MMHEAAAAGLDNLLTAMLLAGRDSHEENTGLSWYSTPVLAAARRNRLTTMELLLASENKPDLAMTNAFGETALATAAARGYPRMVELLLQGGADVLATGQRDKSLVESAVDRSQAKVVDILIRATPGFPSESTFIATLTPPLAAAAEIGSVECVRVLLAHGADPNVEYQGKTPLYNAVASGHSDIVRLILAHGPNPAMDTAPEGKLSLLMSAVRTGNTDIVSLLIGHGCRVDFVDRNAVPAGRTPLSLACAQGTVAMVKLLLSQGANINYTGGVADSPLLTALSARRPEVAELLLEDKTVDVKWAAADGTTALHEADFTPDLIPELLKRGAPIDGNSTLYGSPLHVAVRRNHVKALLANDPKPEVDYVYRDDGELRDSIGLTPLLVACRSRFLLCVQLLLEHGANPRATARDGDDAVDFLLRQGPDSGDLRKLLRMLQCLPYGVAVDRVDENGWGRLHRLAATPGSLIELLVEANPALDLDLQTKAGHTALSIAVGNGNTVATRYLVERGANVNGCRITLHLAVGRGDLMLAKLLVDSGANLEAVDAKYGHSLLYTALGIPDDGKRVAMIRYLVDEAKAPVNKPCGAEFSYPIIRAAIWAGGSEPSGLRILKFLIRRNAQLNVADSQGRRAVHVLAGPRYAAAMGTLVKAGAEIDAKDALGRRPIHFAASNWTAVWYLINTRRVDMSKPDDDGWTPLMWAAFSGSRAVELFVKGGVDLWAQARGPVSPTDLWSARKLMSFAAPKEYELKAMLQPREGTRTRKDGKAEEWVYDLHNAEAGAWKDAYCRSCLSVSPPSPLKSHWKRTLIMMPNPQRIVGFQWKCAECKDDFSLCFRCFSHRSKVHGVRHVFRKIGSLYEKSGNWISDSYSSDEDYYDSDES